MNFERFAVEHESTRLQLNSCWAQVSTVVELLVFVVIAALGIACAFLADGDLDALCRKAFAQWGAFTDAGEFLG